MIGTLDLVFESRGGRTVLAHAYAESPLRIGSTFAVDDAMYVILVCTGPGIFDGDALRQSIHVKRGARVTLTSQSAQQAHPSRADTGSRIDHRYRVDDGAELHCHWDPVIPFADARLAQRFDVDLANGARLYWSDAIMCGRASRGERWQFRHFSHELRLAVDGRLRYLERYGIDPATRQVGRRWAAGEAEYLGTTLVRHDEVTADHAATMQETLNREESVTAGVDIVEDRLLAARLIGSSGVPFSHARTALRTFACASIFASPDLTVRK